MANVLSEEKKQQVLALGRLGWSLRQIQQATHIRRETAGQYLKAAGIAVRPPGGWGRRSPKPANEVITDFGAGKAASAVITDPNCNPKTNPENLSTKGKAKATSKPANEVITDSEVITDLNPFQRDEVGALSSGPVASPQRSPSASACEPYREAIELGLRHGRNAVAIYQDLVDQYRFANSYQSVQRFVRKLRGTQTPEARVVITTPPGQEAQVDYGTGPMVRDPESRKYRRTRLFVMTLGCSRKAVRLLVFRSSARIWAELHERAFRRLGGATRIVVHDNLREGVLVPDIYDPALNPLYRDVLAHYGAVAMPCRIQDPDRKGKVESGVGHAQKTPLKGLRFESLEEAQAYLDRWEERWADATLDGTRKEHMEFLVTVPLLIIDDLGMRKLPLTAAEELLEIIMRRYERASTILTSNRPVEDWGKLLGDAAAVSAMLDRLLHHGHVLKCGPRSWRTKTDLPLQEAAG
jgi:transposase